jgi:hypothetical protein
VAPEDLRYRQLSDLARDPNEDVVEIARCGLYHEFPED